jgi:elongation factor 1-beta
VKAQSNSLARNAERQPSGDARNAAASAAHTNARNAASQDHRRQSELAKVMVSLKIFPSDIVADMNGLKDTIKKSLEGKATIYRFDEEPVAFGLVALVAHILVPDEASGVMDEVERRLKSIKSISEVEVLVSRRIA